MAANNVYSPTTMSNPKASCFLVPSESLDRVRFVLKVAEVLLSFVAFVLEEVISSCISCTALYFFEFISCTAFLFTLLLLILLSTTLHTKVGIACWPQLDFVYTAGIALLFFIASIIFASGNLNMMERSAAAFGFLATFVFVADIIMFVKSNGFPFKKDGRAESSNGGPAAAAAAATEPAEKEKLTAVTSAAD